MNITVKFVSFNKADVIATSCYDASLPVVEFNQRGTTSDYYLRYANGECNYSGYYYLYDDNGYCNRCLSEYMESDLEVGKRYHIGSGPNGYPTFYPCDSNHDLTDENPFAG